MAAARDRALPSGSQLEASLQRASARASDRHGRAGAALKRATDVAAAVLLLVLLGPALLLIAVAIRLDSPGPPLFRQRRIGRHGREFQVLKFRSMAAGASPELHRRYIEYLAHANPEPPGGALLKLTSDPRITRLGAFLRKTSIDELPQLVNVLLGQMSLVGPRPAMPYELQHYRPHHYERFAVRPGITGLWQVSGRARLGLQEMLELDVLYARTHSFLLDMRLLLRTPRAVISARTA